MTAAAQTNPAARVLGSDWGRLSDHLLAYFTPVDDKGAPIAGEPQVRAPLSEGNVEVSLNWQSPFEQSSPDTKAPAISAMIQSGQVELVVAALTRIAPGDDQAQWKQDLRSGTAGLADSLRGRTSITKINSRQIFSGMPPIKFTITAHFRAYRDARKEVEQPIDQLMRWALPKKLYADGILNSLADPGATSSATEFIRRLFPSEAPTLIGFRYAGRNLSPMVIESIGYPIVAPRGDRGDLLTATVQMTIATLTALDQSDWAATRRAA
jgi:hypothetical protein